MKIKITKDKDDQGRQVFRWRCGDRGGYCRTREDALNDAKIAVQPAPTVWPISEPWSNVINCEIWGADGSKIAVCNSRYTAQAIVRAVNVHSELVASLEQILDGHGNQAGVLESARAAIEKAKGQS